MAEESTNERQALQGTISRLRLELEEQQENEQKKKDYPSSHVPGDDDGLFLKIRREWQCELEAAHHRLAELEELEHVESVKKKAIDSGLVEALVETVETGECPLCLEDMPTVVPATECGKRSKIFRRFWCCGAICCVPCIVKREKDFKQKVLAQGPHLFLDSGNEYDDDLNSMRKCPFCRSPNNGDAHLLSLLHHHGKAGKSWANYELGQTYGHGLLDQTPPNRAKAFEFFQLAANAGDLLAMVRLGELCDLGVIGIDGDCSHGDKVAAKQASKEKEQQYYLQAARQGHFLGQFYYADTLHDTEKNGMADVSEQALLFYTLSAAQGFARAQFKLADYYNEQYPVSDTTLVFKAIYWMKKAALQGNAIAQIRLPFLLLDAKAWLFENQVDIAGYSAVPEACFWFDLAEDKFQGQGVERPYPLFLLECGCCGKSQEALVAPAALKRCAKCKGVRYCGRDCQAMHWTMGHKVECKAVVSYRKTLVTPPSMYTYPYPVHVSQEEMLAKINTSN